MAEGRISRLSIRSGRLEGDFFCRRRLNGSVGALPEKPDLPRHDFSAVALAASVLGFVPAGGKSSFDVDLAAFVEESFARVRQPAECHYSEPFRALLPRSVAVYEVLGRRQRKIRHVLSRVGQSTNDRVRTQI